MKRGMHELKVPETKAALLTGQFDTNSTSAPDGVDGCFSGVVRDGVGTFTCTLKEALRVPDGQVLHAWAEVVSTADTRAKIKSITESAGQVTAVVIELRVPDTSAVEAAAAWSPAIVVTADVAAAQTAGWVTNVVATAGSVTGPKQIINTGTPATLQVLVEYTAGVPTITFNDGTDDVTECVIQKIVPAAAEAASNVADTNNETVFIGLLVRRTLRTTR